MTAAENDPLLTPRSLLALWRSEVILQFSVAELIGRADRAKQTQTVGIIENNRQPER